jgi:ribosomal protein S18 acetylase RimI-like enzyme
MGVRPASRGRGLGKALLATATARFQQAGASRALLSVNVNNPGAAALYRSFGFERLKQYRSFRKPLA